MEEKIKIHEQFWKGEGPGLILIPPSRAELYDLNDSWSVEQNVMDFEYHG